MTTDADQPQIKQWAPHTAAAAARTGLVWQARTTLQMQLESKTTVSTAGSPPMGFMREPPVNGKGFWQGSRPLRPTQQLPLGAAVQTGEACSDSGGRQP